MFDNINLEKVLNAFNAVLEEPFRQYHYGYGENMRIEAEMKELSQDNHRSTLKLIDSSYGQEYIKYLPQTLTRQSNRLSYQINLNRSMYYVAQSSDLVYDNFVLDLYPNGLCEVSIEINAKLPTPYPFTIKHQGQKYTAHLDENQARQFRQFKSSIYYTTIQNVTVAHLPYIVKDMLHRLDDIKKQELKN